MWLALRRAIALAELSGISRVPKPQHDGSYQEKSSQESDVWEAICATDRNCSMMFNLPAGTASYSFPNEMELMSHGRPNPKIYNYHLANICLKIHNLDESYRLGRSDTQTYADVLRTDDDLRSLATKIPSSWWESYRSMPLAEQLIQFWHHYLITRVHLRHAIKDDPEGRFAYSQNRCLKGCRESIERFLVLRRFLPTEFFICRVVDIQTCTMCILLLLLQSKVVTNAASQPHCQLVDQVVHTLQEIQHSPTAGEAAEAIASFRSFIEGTQFGAQDTSLTLRIPLLGKIEVKFQNQGPKSQDASGDVEMAHQHGYRRDQQAHQTDQSQMPSIDTMPSGVDLPWTFDFEASSLSWMDDFWDNELFSQNAGQI